MGSSQRFPFANPRWASRVNRTARNTVQRRSAPRSLTSRAQDPAVPPGVETTQPAWWRGLSHHTWRQVGRGTETPTSWGVQKSHKAPAKETARGLWPPQPPSPARCHRENHEQQTRDTDPDHSGQTPSPTARTSQEPPPSRRGRCRGREAHRPFRPALLGDGPRTDRFGRESWSAATAQCGLEGRLPAKRSGLTFPLTEEPAQREQLVLTQAVGVVERKTPVTKER